MERNMTNDSERTVCRRVLDKINQLFHYQLRKKYDMSLWLYADENTDTAECSHRFTGDSRHHVWKIAALVGGMALFFSMLRCVCGLCQRK